MRIRIAILVALLAPISASSALAETTFFGPTPYLQLSDTPDDFYCRQCNDCMDVLEDFEDDSIDHGITITSDDGRIIGPGFGTGLAGLTDSVDGDDGSIDGLGNQGHSYFERNNSISVSFDSPVKSAGLTWTDGAVGTTTTFEAFDAAGVSLGMIGPFSLADGSFQGTTGEDAFLGAMHTDGISRIVVRNLSGAGLEIDHIQYSACNCAVPEPAAGLMASVLAMGTLMLRRRRS